MKEKVVVEAPASTANLGPGFDVFGLAFSSPKDRVTVSLAPSPGIRLQVAGDYAERIPVTPRQNSAGLAAQSMMKELRLKGGLTLKIEKGVPVGMGIGSSGASAAAAVVGINFLFDLQLSQNELIRFAAKGEIASAGFEHADNVSASVLGGFTIIRSYEPMDVISLEAPQNMAICVASPAIRTAAKKTGIARSILPKRIQLKNLVANVGNASTIVAGFTTKNVDLIGRAMQDIVVEPARSHLIPGYLKVREKALKFGASGVAISGAGPSMIALLDENKADPFTVAEAMREGFDEAGVNSSSFVTKAGRGARVIEPK